jgi:hypothetical protein
VKVTVLHRGYGCDTGCCGHVIEVNGKEQFETFDFVHPFISMLGNPNADDSKKWAEDFVRDKLGDAHVADLDWENCEVSDD